MNISTSSYLFFKGLMKRIAGFRPKKSEFFIRFFVLRKGLSENDFPLLLVTEETSVLDIGG